MNFNYYLPVNIIFGRGKVAQIGEITKAYGKKALIVTGGNSSKKSGLLDRVISYLTEAGIESDVYDKVKQNPLTTTAMDGASFAKEHTCDVVVALGGGSIMDCAKAIAFLAVNEGDVNDYIFNIKQSDKALPCILVPTTCGTGSEGNGFAVLTNPVTGDKKSLRCNAIIAKASIVDSELMETMPKSILASVGFDAFCHSLEAYISKTAQPFTEIMCLYAMQLTGKYLIPLYKGDTSPQAWDALSLASTIGGMVIHTAGVTVSHGLEHPASGLKDLVHGKGLAALTPVVVEESIKGCPEKFAKVSQCIGGKDETDCTKQIRNLLEKLDLSIGLKEQGIKEEDIEWMVENAFKVSTAGIANHPVTFTKEDVIRIYKKSM